MPSALFCVKRNQFDALIILKNFCLNINVLARSLYCIVHYFPLVLIFPNLTNGFTHWENLFWAAVLSLIVGHYCKIWCSDYDFSNEHL